MANNVKNIQLAFGYPPYPGAPNVRRGPRAYYDLRGLTRHWLHYNGLFTPTIITESGSWDALVARITADPHFPQPAAGVAPAFPKPSSPSTWDGDQCRVGINQSATANIWLHSTHFGNVGQPVSCVTNTLVSNLEPQRPNIPPADQLVARATPPPSERGPGVPIPLALEMMDWALANVALIHRMPGFDDGVNNDLSVSWTNQANIAFILPGGNPHYGLPVPDPAQPLPPPPGPVVDALAITRAIQTVVASLEVPLQGYTDLLLQALWKETPGVVGSFVVVDSATVPKVNPTSELFPWRGPHVPAPEDHYFLHSDFVFFANIVQELAGGNRVREVLISLTNLDEDSGWVPTRYMGITNIRHMHLWAAQMDSDLKRHLCDGGSVFVQVILRSSQLPLQPPPMVLPLTPPYAGNHSWTG
ncbi:hypothetical protein EV426DRAFT_712718 [Tirmania nivea]|nr:hypothetical protein EV426DRAFT_712718 [Tirmania nivea]